MSEPVNVLVSGHDEIPDGPIWATANGNLETVQMLTDGK